MPERRKDSLIKHHSVFPPIHPQSLRLDNSIRNSLFHRRHLFLKFRMKNIFQHPISQSDILLFHRKHLLGISQILYTNPIQGIKKQMHLSPMGNIPHKAPVNLIRTAIHKHSPIQHMPQRRLFRSEISSHVSEQMDRIKSGRRKDFTLPNHSRRIFLEGRSSAGTFSKASKAIASTPCFRACSITSFLSTLPSPFHSAELPSAICNKFNKATDEFMSILS